MTTAFDRTANIPSFTSPAGASALPPFPKRAMAFGVLLPIALLLMLGWSIVGAERGYQETLNRASQGARLLSTLAHLDEVLSMSAVVAAWTGDPIWEDRYRDNLVRYRTAVTESLALVPEPERGRVAPLGQEITRRPEDLEIKVFELARAGHVEEARQILDQGEYRHLKNASRWALQNFRTSLSVTLEREKDAAHDAMARWKMLAGVGLLAMMAAWAELARRMLRWRDRLLRGCDNRLAQAEEHFVHYISDFSRSMAAMTESLTFSARQLRANCQSILEHSAPDVGDTPPPVPSHRRGTPTLRVISNDGRPAPDSHDYRQ
ncbi:MAG TPA: hypothetical protein VEB64_07980 [Azospirillaceae bacterium]|nr:hypothetical protein [Azospirillaceae bacterium]